MKIPIKELYIIFNYLKKEKVTKEEIAGIDKFYIKLS